MALSSLQLKSLSWITDTNKKTQMQSTMEQYNASKVPKVGGKQTTNNVSTSTITPEKANFSGVPSVNASATSNIGKSTIVSPIKSYRDWETDRKSVV